MRLVCISDTHTMGPKVTVPDGDVLLHTGDHTFRGTLEETEGALEWLSSLPHKHKVFIAGNHDFFWDSNAPAQFRGWKVHSAEASQAQLEIRKRQILLKYPGLTYLQDSGVEIEGVKFYGSPWQPWFYEWAFNFPSNDGADKAKEIWGKIPANTHVLLTHTPPKGIRDQNVFDGPHNHRLGDPHLRERIGNLDDLWVHAFGHIHGGYGIEVVDGTTFVNGAICTEGYEPTNLPIVVDV